MSYLIFCSFEVGALPYKFAEILNRNGVKAYYISFSRKNRTHDSVRFHYGTAEKPAWDLSGMMDINPLRSSLAVKRLMDIRKRFGITGSFATGSKSFLLACAGIPYVYWSYGSDLDSFFFPRSYPVNYPMVKRWAHFLSLKLSFSKQMKATLRSAAKIMIAPYQKEGLESLRADKELFFLSHVFATPEDFGDLMTQKQRDKEAICEQLHAEDFFFSSVRHVWEGKNRLLSDYKGNDVVLRSFAHYLRQNKKTNQKLVLVNKGYDAASSRRLVDVLGIRDHVVWMEEVKREVLMTYYRGAKLCFGQFGTPVITNAALEPLSCATPCASYFGQGDNGLPYYKSLPPAFNSKDPDKIADFMNKIDKDRGFQEGLQKESWEWIRENCSEKRFVDAFVRAVPDR